MNAQKLSLLLDALQQLHDTSQTGSYWSGCTRKELFHVFFLPDHQNSSHRKHAAGAFLDFLSVRILKLCSMYFDFQKIERKKSKRALFWAPFSFFGVTFCSYPRWAAQAEYCNYINTMLCWLCFPVIVTKCDPKKWKWHSEKRSFRFFPLNFLKIKIHGTQL